MKWPHNCAVASGTCQMGEHAWVSHSLPALLDVSIANLWCQRLADGGWEGDLVGGGGGCWSWSGALFSGSNLLNWYSRFGGLPTKLQAVLGATFASGGEISAVCSVVYMSYKRCAQRLVGQNVAQSVFPLFYFFLCASESIPVSFELVLAGSKLVQDGNHLFKTKNGYSPFWLSVISFFLLYSLHVFKSLYDFTYWPRISRSTILDQLTATLWLILCWSVTM